MISDISDLSTSERYFYLAAIDCCKKKIDENVSIKDAVEQIISEYQKLTIISDFGRLRKALYEEVSQVSSQYNTIKSKDVKNRNWWTEFRDDTSFPQNYWTRYYDYLSCKTGWSRTSIDDLDKSTDEVMNALANPRIGKADERRGLVYGDVQSGKTAHYIGIINKAYSAGYKIIIVLTTDPYTAYCMVEEGLGISINNRLTTEKWTGRVELRPLAPAQSISLGLAVPDIQEMSPAASKFVAQVWQIVNGKTEK